MAALQRITDISFFFSLLYFVGGKKRVSFSRYEISVLCFGRWSRLASRDGPWNVKGGAWILLCQSVGSLTHLHTRRGSLVSRPTADSRRRRGAKSTGDQVDQHRNNDHPINYDHNGSPERNYCCLGVSFLKCHEILHRCRDVFVGASAVGSADRYVGRYGISAIW